MPAYSCQRRRIESANAKALWNSGDMVMDPHASGNESNDHEPEVWPDGPIAPLRPLVLTGVKSLAFYLVNLVFLLAVVLPILAIEPFALWGLDCFLHRNPSLVALRIPLGLVIVFILILSASSVILLFRFGCTANGSTDWGRMNSQATCSMTVSNAWEPSASS